MRSLRDLDLNFELTNKEVKAVIMVAIIGCKILDKEYAVWVEELLWWSFLGVRYLIRKLGYR